MRTGPTEFTTTRWSLILRAGKWDQAGASAAMEELCRLYWFPLYAYTRRRGYSHEDASDLTQDFFGKLIHAGFPARLRPEGGRLRSYLLTGLNRHLINHWEKAQRQKRGSGHSLFSIEAEIENRGEAAFAAEMSHHETAEHLFQRTWAEALLTRVFHRLESECEQRGDSRFRTLRPFLTAGGDPPPLQAAAEELGLSIPAFKSLLHRFRQRYRELLFSEVADTVSNPAEVEEEIRALISSLRNA